MTDGTLSDMIRKFEDHPSIMKIGENINKNSKPKSQFHKDISTKIIEDNRDIFWNLITDNFNSGIYNKGSILSIKRLNLRQYLKTIQGLIKIIMDQSVYYRQYLSCMTD